MSHVVAVANQKGLAVNGKTTAVADTAPLRPLKAVLPVSARIPSFEGIIGS